MFANRHYRSVTVARKLAVWLTCVCLTTMMLPARSHADSAASLKAKVASLAPRYSRAMSEIERVASMNLSSRQDLRQALDILRRNDSDLKYLTYRLIEIAMNNRTLQKSAEDKLRGFLEASPTLLDKIKKAKADPGKKIEVDATEEVQAWVNQLKDNPKMIRDWPGVSQAEQELKNQIARDKQALRRVAANLKRAGKPQGVSLMGRSEGASLTLRPAAFTHSVAYPEPASSVQGLEIFILVNLLAAVTGVLLGLAFSGVLFVAEVQVPVLPSAYEQCKAYCEKWRDDCIALAQRVGNEDDEAMCWYRYYDDCLWSDCEPLRQR